ncbi:S26 family signal peptidase [Streptomyces sp. NPDC056831]|uniref:S26 family signal peptidase n=1 Tax=Streptomyces sp. NPDC056831 TaxID=3345954 RepID=UPI0036908A6E
MTVKRPKGHLRRSARQSQPSRQATGPPGLFRHHLPNPERFTRRVAVARERVPHWGGRCPGTHVPPGMLVLSGERPGSVDSKQLGYCPEDKLIGTVLFRLWAAAASGARSSLPS